MPNQNLAPSQGKEPLIAYLLSLGLVLAIFGGIVWISSSQLRSGLRESAIQRYVDIWTPVTQFHIEQGRNDELFGGLEFEDVMVFSLIEAQEIEGSLGLQVFGSQGEFLSGIPASVDERNLYLSEIDQMQSGEAWGVFYPLGIWNEGSAPELELNIPIKDRVGEEIVALARHHLDGQGVLDEFKEIDREVANQATWAYAGGASLVLSVFLWLGWRLRRARNLIAERANRLAQANAELAMVAKTSAVGAVASHLIHGLKNPLAGVSEHLSTAGASLSDKGDWEDAKQATSRMQSMINEVVDVLRNEELDRLDTLSGIEIKSYLKNKYLPLIKGKQIDLGIRVIGDLVLSARDANIAKLIVSNLLDNAIHAVLPGGEVEVRIRAADGKAVFSVIDTGPGFSIDARENLFAPIQSAKSSGAGIGLAISHQLARHLGAVLELVRTSSSGSEIRLSIPLSQSIR